MSRAAGRYVDRRSAVRAALRTLVARGGFHGASMAAVAAEAGVATGTAYVHYASKDELVLAAYLEVKRDLGTAAVAGVDPASPPEERFRRMWHGIYRHLAAEPDRARFLVQVDGSPYARTAHARAMAEEGDPIMVEVGRADFASRLAPLPAEVLYDIGIGPAVRLAASGERLSPASLAALAASCWRAVTRAEAGEGRESPRPARSRGARAKPARGGGRLRRG